MKRFASLLARFNETTSTTAKRSALVEYFRVAHGPDKIWALALLAGRHPKRQVNSTLLREWLAEIAGLPVWLVEESYHIVGDLAECLALILPTESDGSPPRTLTEWMEALRGLEGATTDEKREFVVGSWRALSRDERFVFNKLITGSFRTGVSKGIVVQALSEVLERDVPSIEHALMGSWSPVSTTFEDLFDVNLAEIAVSRPYPFFLAHPLQDEVASLGDPLAWQAEYKWDGIRAQIIRRGDLLFVWSRGEELITDRFPELGVCARVVPAGTVLDGELLCAEGAQILPFNVLQTRIGRKKLTDKALRDAPVRFLAFDLLEWEGQDIRTSPLERRRDLLTSLIHAIDLPILAAAPAFCLGTWEEVAALRQQARSVCAEGLMLKRTDSQYRTGRKLGEWWKWKLDPYSVDAVLIYAQRGHGRRANLFTDYTFGVWHEGSLVPFAKAYSGLTDKEINEVDSFIKRHTIDRFGPVRTVTPELVFEIGFEGIQESKRHKCGVAVRFPRILRWRKDKTKEEADTLEALRSLL